jgi:hypothetical protein
MFQERCKWWRTLRNDCGPDKNSGEENERAHKGRRRALPGINNLTSINPIVRNSCVLFLAYFPYFKKMKIRLCDLHAVCLWIHPPPPLTFEFLNQSLWDLVFISWHLSQFSTAYFGNPSHQSVYLLFNSSVTCIPLVIAGQWLAKHVPSTTNTHNNRRNVGRACLWICLLILLSLLAKNSVRTLPLQRRIIEGVVFCAAHISSKEIRRLILPRTSCFIRFYFIFLMRRIYVWKICSCLLNVDIVELHWSGSQTNIALC